MHTAFAFAAASFQGSNFSCSGSLACRFAQLSITLKSHPLALHLASQQYILVLGSLEGTSVPRRHTGASMMPVTDSKTTGDSPTRFLSNLDAVFLPDEPSEALLLPGVLVGLLVRRRCATNSSM